MKTEPRTLKELGEIMLLNKSLFEGGLCRWVRNLNKLNKITDLEAYNLKTIINNNRPKFKWFHSLYNPYNLHPFTVFYWAPEELTPRIEWIKKYLIKNKR